MTNTPKWILVLALLSSYALGQQVNAVPSSASNGGGGAAQLQVRNAGDTAWVNVGFNVANLSLPVILQAGGATIGAISNTSFNVGNFPAIQPVSQSGTWNIGTLTSITNPVAVTGTFFQATQPVSWSGQSVSVSNFPSTYDTSDRAARLLGVIYGSQAQQLKQTATNFNAQMELATGATLYDARQVRALTSADVVTANQGTSPWVVSCTTANCPQPTLTKGTQGATGYSVQELKDAGRTRITFTADRVTPAATDTLVTFVINNAGTATTAQTTRTVTAGKTFRVQSIYIGVAASTTTAVSVRFALRENTGGACTASSAAVAMLNAATPAAVAAEGSSGAEQSFPDGLEFPAADSICISAIGSTATGTLTASVVGYEY
jgi:hypothetical protein